MTAKKWIMLGIVVVVASALLVVTVVAAPVAQSSEAGLTAVGSEESALSANRRIVVKGPGGSLGIAAATPVSTAFTYQGQLKDGGEPVNDDCGLHSALCVRGYKPAGATRLALQSPSHLAQAAVVTRYTF
jgi:hypothetical protein